MHNDNEFYQLGKKLLTEIAALRKAIETTLAELERKEQQQADAEEVKRESPPLTVPIDIVNKEEIWGTESERSQKDRQSNRQFWIQVVIQGILTLATIGAFIAAVVYAGIAAKQHDVMDKTLTEVQKQTKILHQQMVGTQAAALRVAIGFDES